MGLLRPREKPLAENSPDSRRVVVSTCSSSPILSSTLATFDSQPSDAHLERARFSFGSPMGETGHHLHLPQENCRRTRCDWNVNVVSSRRSSKRIKPDLVFVLWSSASCSGFHSSLYRSLSSQLLRSFRMRFSTFFSVLACGAMALAAAVTPDVLVSRGNSDISNAISALDQKCDSILPQFG